MADGNSNLHRLAIDAALNSNWNQALDLNLQIVKTEPDNTDCLNRLARAYMELHKYSEAKKIYQEVLKIDPYNSIAQKNLKKVATMEKNNNVKIDGQGDGVGMLPISPALFLEEPGITQLVTLIKVAEPQKLLSLSCGSMVNLVPKNRGITVADGRNNYLGVLPDDTAFHLLKLMKGGYKYQAIIKSVKPNSLTVFIREVFRSKKFRNQASFTDGQRIFSYSFEHVSLIRDEGAEPAEESLNPDDLSV